MTANQPIPVKDALKLIEMALEEESKATPGPWEIRHEFNVFGSRLVANCGGCFNNTKSNEVHAENVANAIALVLARATMRPMLEFARAEIDGMFYPHQQVSASHGWIYPALAALRDHYDRVRPGWRDR